MNILRTFELVKSEIKFIYQKAYVMRKSTKMWIGILTVLPHQFYICKMQSYIFVKHFLILPNLFEGSTLINYGFLLKEDLIVISILDFTG